MIFTITEYRIVGDTYDVEAASLDEAVTKIEKGDAGEPRLNWYGEVESYTNHVTKVENGTTYVEEEEI